ncbi:nucleoside deaminase [Robertkochia sediminum]|uniref:nucleoside deaminase n=1 Tax=Robertkochia sediminum TaxID=2785326 RepID=UPI0019335369|nr:nucleoside deaminase [Robertkochia sediminum]MBL7471347.1 nucleoside deaminase [Robertkochia sediminum]
MEKDIKFLQQAIALGRKGMHNNSGGPFGCVIVKDDEVIGRGFNQVLSTVDPTAHAEVVAIREACRYLNNGDLSGCTLYTSCEPCPMCLGAIYWARPDRIVFACTREDAAGVGFDDDFIYKEINVPISARKITTENKMREEALEMMKEWLEKEDRIGY